MMMDSNRALTILQSKISRIDDLKNKDTQHSDFIKWKRDVEIAIEKIFGTSSRNLDDFESIRYSVIYFYSTVTEAEKRKHYNTGLDKAAAILQSMIDEIEEYGDNEESQLKAIEPTKDLIFLCEKFHSVAKQLRYRHGDRETFDINDEYDVQDLMRALLYMFFDDIRPEEWTPSYAGASSRVDFLLKNEKIVIEIKKTRAGLNAKKLGEELIVDIARYKKHPECKTLICFVYDVDDRIRNPRGIEGDLSKNHDGLETLVLIRP